MHHATAGSAHIIPRGENIKRKAKVQKKENFPFIPIKLQCWLQIDFQTSKASYSFSNPQLWHLVEARGSSLGLRAFPIINLNIHSYHATSSIPSQHSNLFFFQSSHSESNLSTCYRASLLSLSYTSRSTKPTYTLHFFLMCSLTCLL